MTPPAPAALQHHIPLHVPPPFYCSKVTAPSHRVLPGVSRHLPAAGWWWLARKDNPCSCQHRRMHFRRLKGLPPVPQNWRDLAQRSPTFMAPHTSHFTPHTCVTPHTSHLTPHTSHLTPHTSHLTLHSSHLTPHASHLTPHTSHQPHLHSQQQQQGSLAASFAPPQPPQHPEYSFFTRG